MQGFGGPAGLQNQLPQHQGGEWRSAGRFVPDAAPCQDGRGQLVRHQVEREIERCDGQQRPQRHAAHQAHAAFEAGGEVERKELAVQATAQRGSMAEGGNAARDFGAGVLQGLASLEGDELRDGFMLGVQAVGHAIQHLDALV